MRSRGLYEQFVVRITNWYCVLHRVAEKYEIIDCIATTRLEPAPTYSSNGNLLSFKTLKEVLSSLSFSLEITKADSGPGGSLAVQQQALSVSRFNRIYSDIPVSRTLLTLYRKTLSAEKSCHSIMGC